MPIMAILTKSTVRSPMVLRCGVGALFACGIPIHAALHRRQFQCSNANDTIRNFVYSLPRTTGEAGGRRTRRLGSSTVVTIMLGLFVNDYRDWFSVRGSKFVDRLLCRKQHEQQHKASLPRLRQVQKHKAAMRNRKINVLSPDCSPTGKRGAQQQVGSDKLHMLLNLSSYLKGPKLRIPDLSPTATDSTASRSPSPNYPLLCVDRGQDRYTQRPLIFLSKHICTRVVPVQIISD